MTKPKAKTTKKKAAIVPKKRRGTPEEQAQRAWFEMLRSFFRRAWSKFPERLAAIQNAKRPSKSVNKKLKWEYQCNICKNWYQWKTKQQVKKSGGVGLSVDHITPAGTFLEPKDFMTFIPQLFCSRTGLQVLCDVCHDKKTSEEKK